MFKTLLTRVLFFFTLIFVLASPSLCAQDDEGTVRRGSKVIDDSTRSVYGPNTSRYYFEDDFFQNRKALHPIDTTSWNFHRFSYVQRFNNLYQDLGNIGTAIRPIYNQGPDAIGASSGFDAYDLYWTTETIRHYDTKSPYSNMKLALGGKGRSVTRITFSRNITPRWNFGFNYRTLLIDKQIQRRGKGDRNVRSTYVDLNTVFHTKDSTYSIFASFRRNFQQADEFGGVVTGDDYEYSDLFLQNSRRALTEAESNDRRSNLHLFHQLRLGSGLQIYHKTDYYMQMNKFNDSDPTNEFYDFTVVDSAVTRDKVDFRSFRNEAGVKGNLLKLFYNGYAALRKYSMDYKYFNEKKVFDGASGDEFYVGGRIGLQLDSLVDVKGSAEWMFDNRYIINASIRTKWFEAFAKRSVSTPTFLQQAYRGSHDFWTNPFSKVDATEIGGNLIYKSKSVGIYPGIKFSTFKNYIFFKQDTTASQDVLPVQSNGFQTWANPELNFSLTFWKHVNITSQIIYTKILENDKDALQVPDLFVNSQLSYSNIWFKGNLDFQAGVDVHWKSAYYANGYDPVIQQYYVQQNFKVPSFPVIDFFLNAKIKHARIFVKYNNFLLMFSDYGNIPTPYYPGLRNIVDFGFDWSFYD